MYIQMYFFLISLHYKNFSQRYHNKTSWHVLILKFQKHLEPFSGYRQFDCQHTKKKKMGAFTNIPPHSHKYYLSFDFEIS